MRDGLLYTIFIYYMVMLWFAILAFQLQLNHLDKPWIRKMEEFENDTGSEQIKRPESHIHRHIRACTNIETPRWLDWAWGGLQKK